jgi:hypothetical protein
MQRGAVAVFDALGIKGIWKRHSARDVLRKLADIEKKYHAVQRSEFGSRFQSLRQPGNWLRRVRHAFLSDSVVISVEMKEPKKSGANQPDPCVLDAAAIVFAARFAGSVMRLGASLDPKWNYRGCISFGEFSMRRNFIVGAAVDAAVGQMDLAQGAFVWLTPEALDVVTMKFPSGFGNPWPLTRHAVPLKAVGTLDTFVASPFDFQSDEAARTRLRQDILAGFHGTSLDVVVKRQNTAAFLESHLAEFRQPLAHPSESLLVVDTSGQVFLRGAGNARTALPMNTRGPVLDDRAAIARVFDFPAIKEWGQELARVSGGTVRLGLRVDASPTPNAEPGTMARAWRVAVYESHPGHLSNHRRLAVDADSGAVFVYDPLDDSRAPYDGTSDPSPAYPETTNKPSSKGLPE